MCTAVDEQTSSSDSEDRLLLQAGYRFALSLTHSPHDAEDLVQQSWLKLMRGYGRVENKSILFRTIRNLLIDQYRRGQVVVFEPLSKNDSDSESDSIFLLEEQAGSEPGVQADLDTLLAHLSHREREILYLNAVENYSAAEIASLQDSNRNTVLSLLARAKKKLRDIAARERKE